MARCAAGYNTSRIYGIDYIEGIRDYKPFNDLNEVLNKIGVMSRRFKIPYLRLVREPTKNKRYYYCHKDKYYIPKDWRDCLYEDLETGHYYIVSPDPFESEDASRKYSWIAFRVTGLTEGIQYYNRDIPNKIEKEILFHTGSFIDLIKNRDINEVLDTLAKNEKPINITLLRYIEAPKSDCICQFDI